jgi:2-amino-4-hydroxy-6-hydroxymethyldihydropteridine diphosphokinase
MHTAYLSLGSNVGDRRANLAAALDLLGDGEVEIVRASSIWETEPRDLRRQPWFLNLVAETRTRLFPLQLLHLIHRIEKRLGRRRLVEKGPRTIDIDILLFGNSVMDTPELQIPHPRLTDRRFVLEPLAELAPDLRHPVTRESVAEMLTRVKAQKVVLSDGNADAPEHVPDGLPEVHPARGGRRRTR